MTQAGLEGSRVRMESGCPVNGLLGEAGQEPDLGGLSAGWGVWVHLESCASSSLTVQKASSILSLQVRCGTEAGDAGSGVR